MPSVFKIYILMRDAKLPEKAWNVMDTWSHSTYEYDEVATNLRKLERRVLRGGGGIFSSRGGCTSLWDGPLVEGI